MQLPRRSRRGGVARRTTDLVLVLLAAGLRLAILLLGFFGFGLDGLAFALVEGLLRVVVLRHGRCVGLCVYPSGLQEAGSGRGQQARRWRWAKWLVSCTAV